MNERMNDHDTVISQEVIFTKLMAFIESFLNGKRALNINGQFN